MFLRRSITAVAAATALCAVTAPAASAAAPAAPASVGSARYAPAAGKEGKELPEALYGTAEPKYDGVWRQSLALLALDAAGAEPARSAVAWLARQQCADGSFTAYRADADTACDAEKTPGDTNATAAAVQALAAVGGEDGTVREALAWLGSVQNEDGGWGYNPGSPTDANSVSVVIGAYAASGKQPEKISKGGKSPYDALTSLQLGCDAEQDSRGAFAYQAGKDGKDGKPPAANDDATAAAVLAAAGSGLQAEQRPNRPLKPMSCGKGESGEGEKGDRGGAGAALGPDEAAQAGAARLASVLRKNGHHLLAATPGAGKSPDYANTADAVVALAASGHRTEARRSLNWLAAKLSSWDKAESDPAALAGVMLAVHATGGDAATLKGARLLDRLAATGPKPARMPDEKATGNAGQGADGSGGAVLRWSLLGAGLAAGAGAGVLIGARRKRQGR